MLLLLAIAPLTWAHPEEPPQDDPDDGEIVVVGERSADDPSETVLDRDAIEAFPATSTDELLKAAPGIHLSAHGGRGKAFQFFVRGFDAVHGTDVLGTLEGIPLNEPSNIHGQGYLDLHFIPTELVTSVRIDKGLTRADKGDFAVAGSAEMTLGNPVEGTRFAAGGGTDKSAVLRAAYRPVGAPEQTFALAEIEGGLGVGDGRGFAAAHVALGMGNERNRAFLLAYDGVFESPGVLREDDYEAGRLGFWDAYEGAGDGRSRRVLLGGASRRDGEASSRSITAWGGFRQLVLRNNFTGTFYEGLGDGLRQEHIALDAGVRGRMARSFEWMGQTSTVSGGADLWLAAAWQVEQLAALDLSGRQTWYQAQLAHSDAGAWAAGVFRLGHHLELRPGFRADWVGLTRLDEAVDGVIGVGTRRGARAFPISPKLEVTTLITDEVSAYAALGRGFRSPNARGLADGTGRALPISVATTGEAGLRLDTTTFDAFAGAFVTGLRQEVVFDHSVGRYLASGSTRRVGGEAGVAWSPSTSWRTQLDVSLSDGRYTASNEPIPYAPRSLVSAGVYAQRLPVGSWELTAGVRPWLLGPRPTTRGFAQGPTGSIDATAALMRERWTLRAQADNVLNVRWRDGEYVFPSHWSSGAKSELAARHFTAGKPLAVRFEVERAL